MVTITYRSTLTEQVRAARVLLRTNVANWFLLVLFAGVPLATVALLVFLKGWDDRLFPLLLGSAAGLVFWYLFPWIPVLAVRRGVRSVDGPISVTFTDQGVATETSLGRSEAGWRAYLRTRETDEFFLLYYGKNVAVVFPKRAFAALDLARLRELAAQHVAEGPK